MDKYYTVGLAEKVGDKVEEVTFFTLDEHDMPEYYVPKHDCFSEALRFISDLDTPEDCVSIVIFDKDVATNKVNNWWTISAGEGPFDE